MKLTIAQEKALAELTHEWQLEDRLRARRSTLNALVVKGLAEERDEGWRSAAWAAIPRTKVSYKLAGGSKQERLARRAATRTCEWTEDEDGNWFAACGTAWSFTDGGPAENNVRYCHACGGEVVVKPYEEVK